MTCDAGFHGLPFFKLVMFSLVTFVACCLWFAFERHDRRRQQQQQEQEEEQQHSLQQPLIAAFGEGGGRGGDV